MYIYKKKGMLIRECVSLASFNTFGLDYKASCMIHLSDENEALLLFKRETAWKEPFLVLGRGSNILFVSDFKGTIIHPGIEGIRVEKEVGDEVIVSAGAGIEWDKLVEWTTLQGFGGLENLSLIPGTTGAVPVQNIGAYGVEAKDRVTLVETLDTDDGSDRVFRGKECGFGYRTSIFKKEYKGKYLVTRVHFRLDKRASYNLTYGSLKTEVGKLGGATLKNIRQAVINIRQSKIPDPAIIGNAGSFFKNPVVSRDTAVTLGEKYPGLPVYDDSPGTCKLAAGWLIEKCGWKGKRIGDAGVHEKQALVLVNHGEATGNEILHLAEKITASVMEEFGIMLEQEVEIIGIT
jgi:UDP-N-acetylmuramate dehydrogenase